ncbi:MAG: hypothetical protein SFU53_11515 [Terrimicrobiaceae bacterium]|nr:hypothetical protein [Terrimicrobiaceae bacterium]
MKVSRKVSRPVHPPVSLAGPEPATSGKLNRNTKQRSCGPYLVRSGNIWLFQIKLPRRITGGTAKRPLRVSLGALPASEARRVAGILAGLAFKWFQEIELRMKNDEDMDDLPTDGEDNAEEADLLWSFLTTRMKAALYDIRTPIPTPSPEDARRLEGWRDLVLISREVVAKQEGRPHNSLVADNASILAASAAKKFDPVTEAERPLPTLASTPFTSGDTVPPSPPATLNLPPSPETLPLTTAPETRVAPAAPKVTSGPQSDIPPAMQDRRFVERPSSSMKSFSTVAAEYFAQREINTSADDNDIRTARFRANLFLELIGDHPVDTYGVTDLQAYVNLLKYWPANKEERPETMSAREILNGNADLHLAPLSKKTLREGYLTVVKSIFGYAERHHGLANVIRGAKLDYPDTARPSIPSEPLAYHKITQLLQAGVQTEELDYAMLPLLGLLTGRRLALLVHLRGSDLREKFKGVWVAQTPGIILDGKVWKRIPYKTDASITFFVLHEFLVEIGFVEWAAGLGDRFIFQELARLVDPSKSASQYMARLFGRAGIKDTRGEVFHSLRGGYIDESRDQDISERDSKLQVGHEVRTDEHGKYGFRVISEKKARRIASMELNPEIDLSCYQGLDFERMDGKKRSSGRKSSKT